MASHSASQRGFSLLEISIVSAVILLIAVIGIPVIGNYIVESKVPRVGEELARFIMQVRINGQVAGQFPYRGVNTVALAETARESGVLTVAGDRGAPRVLHGLGDGGEVQVAASTDGALLTITLSGVSHVACPGIATVLQRLASVVAVGNDRQALAVVKNQTTPYSPILVRGLCGRGSVNTFVFTLA
ncbi:prepilin-type N-terminal cleavage/methylation domain-containing protein [Pusillimonas sp. TS35]|uniref:prepilin-type N-terminal cleavage/methylation domain-containing protein n=1 Tax=Paracandidimonas lactea TaxID=2895524 RepID=UPI00136B4CEE|nr:prepilin-type N-terminal cleavage/methylation domain-containing protein [Paracandidimonas lactea]MYN11920.1 prepilin-type N-terminal cleavage/methylation domain-containing protein [Pusillimonas sp. TS35]